MGQGPGPTHNLRHLATQISRVNHQNGIGPPIYHPLSSIAFIKTGFWNAITTTNTVEGLPQPLGPRSAHVELFSEPLCGIRSRRRPHLSLRIPHQACIRREYNCGVSGIHVFALNRSALAHRTSLKRTQQIQKRSRMHKTGPVLMICILTI